MLSLPAHSPGRRRCVGHQLVLRSTPTRFKIRPDLEIIPGVGLMLPCAMQKTILRDPGQRTGITEDGRLWAEDCRAEIW